MAHKYNPERSLGPKGFAGALALGAFLMALTVEGVATARDHRRHTKKPFVENHEHDGERAIYVLPGCRADGHYIGQLLEPHIQHIGPTHFEKYQEEGFSIDAVKESLLDARANDQEKPAIFYALSMGGMAMTKLLLDAEFRAKFGKIDKVIFDSSPSSAADLDKGSRIAMLAASLVPASWSTSRLYRHVMRKTAMKQQVDQHSPLISDEQAKGKALATANTPLSAVEGQTKFINSIDFKDGEGVDAANEIGAMYYISSPSDHTVENLDGAYDKYNRVFGGKVLRIVDLMRPEGSHADGPLFPERIVELMQEPLPLPLPDVAEETPARYTQPSFGLPAVA